MKPKNHQVSINPCIPSSRWLLDSIQGHLQPAHMRLLLLYHKTINLLDVYFFLNLSIEKGCLYIHLMYSLTLGCCRGNNHTDRSVLSNMSKCLLIIYSLHLRESSSNKSHFVPLDAPVNYVFDLVDLFGSQQTSPQVSKQYPTHHSS
jgi:hypothetical protein